MLKRTSEGFPITHTVAEAKCIYNMLADEDGYTKHTAGDFDTRKGVTAEPITTSDQHRVHQWNNMVSTTPGQMLHRLSLLGGTC